ncbi:MAG: hypothetical protein FWD31_03520 [Planctomycetaceae bacterium]|nr:hypothetical protein [Planctomycetaceae bacterium]
MSRNRRLFVVLFAFFVLLIVSNPAVAAGESPPFRVGASMIDVTPQQFPVVVNGGFFPQYVEIVQDPLYVRCLVLSDGTEKIALVVVDTCVIPQDFCDEMKAEIVEKTGMAKDRIMISSTHCHSAPALAPTHSADAEKPYMDYLLGKVADAVAQAERNLAPVKVGWAVGNDPNNVFCRRFLMKEGTAMTNAFSDKSNDRAMMNPGFNNPNMIARTGPVDTAVSVLSFVSPDGEPVAVFANYSTHYAGVRGGVLSGDYFGVFSQRIREMIAEEVGPDKVAAQFVGMMSNGTSGDANCIDFLNPDRTFDYISVGRDTAQAAMAVWPNIQYFDHVPLAMVEKRVTIANRVPTPEEVRTAKDRVAQFPDGKPQSIPDVYALNVAEMGDWPKTSEVVVQAIRIGELGITALPGEVYGSTGLEIKARSPFLPTINISLANGNFGYIPPPEQHALGGYNTWRTKYSCLEVDAEPIIKATAVELLQSLAGSGD